MFCQNTCLCESVLMRLSLCLLPDLLSTTPMVLPEQLWFSCVRLARQLVLRELYVLLCIESLLVARPVPQDTLSRQTNSISVMYFADFGLAISSVKFVNLCFLSDSTRFSICLDPCESVLSARPVPRDSHCLATSVVCL